MDSSAIERIEQLAACQKRLDTYLPAVIVPAGCTVRSLETLDQAPARMRATFSTSIVAAFIAYLNTYSTPETSVVSVNSDTLSALAILDYGSCAVPDWGEHTASLKLTPTPEYQALKRITQNPLSQRELLEYIEDWSDELSAYTAGVSLPIPKALSAIRKIDIRSVASSSHEELEHKASRSTLEMVEINESAETLPDVLVLTASLYADTQPVSVRVRLTVRPGKPDPSFILRPVNLDRIKLDIADELIARLNESLELPVYLGTLTSGQPR